LGGGGGIGVGEEGQGFEWVTSMWIGVKGGLIFNLVLFKMTTNINRIKFKWPCKFFYVGRWDVESCLERGAMFANVFFIFYEWGELRGFN
jgi:hypothetical protein